MTVTVAVLVPPKQMEASQTTQYTATSVRAIIDKATVTNTDTVSRTFSVNIVTSGGVAGNANLVIDTRTVQPDETYLCPELVGQVLAPGGFISTIASNATSLTLRVSGREIS
jgi:predicted NodU family carbamoyl transferase